MDDGNKIQSDLYFAIVPEWIIDAPISAQAVRLYATLHRYADKTDKTCYPSINTIAKRMQVSVSTVKRALDELKDVKAITVEARYNKATGEQTSNLYTLMTVPAFIYEPPQTTYELEGSSSESYKLKSYNQSKFAEQYSALVEAFYKPNTKTEIGGFNKCAKQLYEADATYQDIIDRVLVYKNKWANMTITPYAIVKHWTALGILLEENSVKNAPMCVGAEHLQVIKFDDGFTYCGRCKTEYPEKNPYEPS
jgi:DNA-binding Lrp family transcriptional regulator